jgi:hypothetical protein
LVWVGVELLRDRDRIDLIATPWIPSGCEKV